jgi:deoxycytidylate deaminase
MVNVIASAANRPRTPELVFGLVGPVGVDMDAVQTCLCAALKQVGYDAHLIHLTQLMEQLEEPKQLKRRRAASKIEEKIDRANKICQKYNDNSVLASLAISEIRRIRKEVNLEAPDSRFGEETAVEFEAKATAYVVRQLKREEEVDLFRWVYRRNFVQVSVALERDLRILSQKNRLSREAPRLTPVQCDRDARKLIERDEAEEENPFGQKVRSIFHLGDVFISGRDVDSIEATVNRFIQAFFGRNNISPTRDEHGAYLAKAASLRSLDLSRQVGAALVSKGGDLVSIGCNEVPKFGGGNYWADDKHRARDFERQAESNKIETQRIIYDFIDRLRRRGIINQKRTTEDILSDDDTAQALENSLISDITEYGRMTHAEMSAILDAARRGISTEGATLHVTTFPCHNCAKHIVAAGIVRLVYIEPYPKSRAEHSHEDSISIGSRKRHRVNFEHFEGISPRRYAEIFEKGKRRTKDGSIQEWYKGAPLPRIDDADSSHLAREPHAILILESKLGLPHSRDG